MINKNKTVTIKNEKQENISELKQILDNKYSFSDYENVRNFSDIYFTSKGFKLLIF